MDFCFGGWSIIWDAFVHSRISGICSLHQKMNRRLSGFLGYHLKGKEKKVNQVIQCEYILSIECINNVSVSYFVVMDALQFSYSLVT